MPLTSSVWNNFKIRQSTREPGAFRIGDGGGAAVLTGTIPTEDLETILTEGVETATADNNTGLIRRILPVASPRWAWMYLKNVDNCTGISFVEKVVSDPEGQLDAPVLPFFANYAKYEIQATFEPRPYAVISDDRIEHYVIDYYDVNGGVQSKTAWREWWRYTEWLRQPGAEYLTADRGQYKFAAPGGLGGIDSPLDNTAAGQGQIRVLLPSSVWKINWFRVPYQY